MQPAVKYILAATPRAATAYTAELLSNLGLNCGHEQYFRFEQRLDAFLSVEEVFGEASWLAVPFLSRLPDHVRVLHQTRHPLDVIRSLRQIQFLDFDEAGVPVRDGLRLRFTQFACRYCPAVMKHETARQRAIWFYFHWNRMIEEASAGREVLRYDIESLSARRLEQVLSFIGVAGGDLSSDLLAAQLALLPRDINARQHDKITLDRELTWDELPDEVRALARSYGYAPRAAPEPAEQLAPETRAAHEQMRAQAHLVQQAWRRQRAALAARVNDIRSELHDARRLADRREGQVSSLRDELAEERESRAAARLDDRDTREARRQRDNWMCRMVSGQRILDAGCASGSRAILLARERAQVTGIDSEDAAIEAARAALAAEPDAVRQRARFERSTLLAADCEPSSLDTVLLSDVLARATQPALLLARVHELLRDGGRLVVCAPLGYHPDQRCVQSLYPATLLDLIGERFSIDDCQVIRGYLCVAAAKPAAGQALVPPPRDVREGWRRAGEEALEQIERRWSQELVQQRQSNQELRRASAEAARQRHELHEAQARLQATQAALTQAQALHVSLARGSDDSPARPPSQPDGETARPSGSAGGVLFFCVNGVGLGHLTRSLAVARRMRRIDPALPIYFLSSSQALQIISREGMIAYHIPPRAEYGEQMGGTAWNNLLLQQLRIIVATHRPATLVYDGVSPYAGLLNAIAELQFAHTAMILRLRHKHDRLQHMIEQLGTFNELIFPGEHGVEVPTRLAALNHRVFDPIIYLDQDELLSREDARKCWNIPPDKKAVYVQLGAGNIDDTTAWIDRALAALSQRDDVEVILAESPISRRSHERRNGVHILTQYPNSLFCRGFDLAITAVGYNTFHELMHFGVPSILVPNQQTMTDDQVARAMMAREAGAARVALEPDDLARAIKEALSDSVARSMGENAAALVPRNGARSVAEELLAAASQRVAVRERVAADQPLA